VTLCRSFDDNNDLDNDGDNNEKLNEWNGKNQENKMVYKKKLIIFYFLISLI